MDIAIVVRNNFCSSNPLHRFCWQRKPVLRKATGGEGAVLLYRGENRVRILFFLLLGV